jgi:hypothetical protein
MRVNFSMVFPRLVTPRVTGAVHLEWLVAQVNSRSTAATSMRTDHCTHRGGVEFGLAHFERVASVGTSSRTVLVALLHALGLLDVTQAHVKVGVAPVRAG